MKRNILLVALLALVGVAASDGPRRHEAVLLWGSQNGFSSGAQYTYDGALVEISSSSAGAPVFPQYGQGKSLTQIAEAIAQLRDQGYTIKVSESGLFVYATK